MAEFSLANYENYKSQFNKTSTEIFAQYTGLVSEFLVQSTENIYMRNVDYYKYVICKGIETISHVFKMLLLYTKNLDLVSHHCHKSNYYYVEFIGQIGDDHHSFLQLNSKDAALFVYKKTIFDIDQTFRKDFSASIKTSDVLNNINILLKIYINLFSKIVSVTTLDTSGNLSLLNFTDLNIKKVSKILLNLSIDLTESEYYNMLVIVDYFISSLNMDVINILPYIELFSKKLRKMQDFTLENLKSKLLHKNNCNKLNSMTHTKYVNWLFN